MNEPLSLRYRPRSFDEFFGSKEIKESILKNLGTVHLYLLHGERGCGKTSLARLIACELGVDDFEVHEFDATSKRGIDDAKALRWTIYTKPMRGKRKMYIFDEVHMLTREAFSVWLKPMEEPPEHVYFALCTTNVAKVLPTIRSRARAGEYLVRPLVRRDAHALLSWICTEEKLDVDKDVYKAVLSAGEGIPRDTIGLLEKVKGLGREQALDLIVVGGMGDGKVIDLCRLLLASKANKWEKAKVLLRGIEEEPEGVRLGMLKYMSKAMLGEGDSRLAAMIAEEFEGNFYDSGRAGLNLATYRSCLLTDKKIKIQNPGN